jgi:hypothetical protein
VRWKPIAYGLNGCEGKQPSPEIHPKDGVPFFFKQWGGVRKKKNGRELDGRNYDHYPRRIVAPVPERTFCAAFAENLLNLFRGMFGGGSLVEVGG